MRWRTPAGAVILVSVLSACAHQPPPTDGPLPGPLMGLLHGFISPFSLIGSPFYPVRIYEYPNSGFLYDLGFVVGAYAVYSICRRIYVYTSSFFTSFRL